MELFSGKTEHAIKCVLYGVEGVGKSTFASKFPHPLFIDTEGSTKFMDVRRTQTPTSWAMLKDLLSQIKAEPSLCRTLVIDTADWAERLCIKHICDTKGFTSIEDAGYGKGYTMLAEEFGKLLNFLTDLTDLGIHVVMTAHAQIRQTEIPEETGKYEFWTLKLEKKTGPMIKEWADMVLFANYKTLIVEDSKTKSAKARGGQRYMYTTHRTTWDAKNRHDLPEELEFDYSKIAHIFEKDYRSAQPPSLTPPKSNEDKIRETLGETEEPAPVAESVAPAEVPAPAPGSSTGIQNTFVMPDWTDPWTDWKAPEIPAGKDYLKPLYDLMATNRVSDMMIREVCADKGFVTLQQPLENFPENLVSGLLVGQWDGAMGMINKKIKDAMPF